MGNVTIAAPQVDGSQMTYITDDDSCKAAVEFVTSDDLRPPARSLNLTIQTKSGKTVVVVIPNDAKGNAAVLIDDVEV